MKQKITLEILAQKIDKLGNSTDKKIDNLSVQIDDKIEGLARMTAKGFYEMNKKFDKMEAEMKKNEKKSESRFNYSSADLSLMRTEIKEIRKELNKHPNWGQHHHLEERLTVVEERLGIKY